jgi:hypothetical protein
MTNNSKQRTHGTWEIPCSSTAMAILGTELPPGAAA